MTPEPPTTITHIACHSPWTLSQGRALVSAGRHAGVEGRLVFICFFLFSHVLVFSFLGHFSPPPPLTPTPVVCENCVEVDLTAVAIIIVVDICITLGLLMVVYYWSKNRKAKAKPVTRGTGAGGRPRGKTIELGQGRLGPGQDGQQLYSRFQMASVAHSL